MSEGFSSINCSITFKNKHTGTELAYTADISNYTENAMERKVTYKELIGGMLLPQTKNPVFKEIEFEFVSGDSKFLSLINNSNSDFDFNNNNSDLFRIGLRFTDGSDNYFKMYYDAYVISLSSSINDEILSGKIKFSIPMKNIKGLTTYLETTNISEVVARDTEMGY